MIGSLITRKYLAPCEPSYWRWDREAEALELNDGTLLAFRAQFAETLDQLKDDGLPPIGAVLLALHASMHQPNVDGNGGLSGAIEELFERYRRNGQLVPTKLIASVYDKLDVFHATIKSLNDREMTRTAFEMIFEGCPIEVKPDAALAVVDTVKAGPPPDMVKGAPGRDAFDRLLLDLRTLNAGLDGITPEAVRQRHTTGLETLPEPAEVVEPDLPIHAAALQLIEQLESEEEHEALGKAARQVHAAIRMPRRLGSPDDMPLGGLSDVTNRGQLDRLLVSELAQDDLTLAIRVASNEALYLRREESHTRLPTARHLLIDMGLRQWGVARVMSVAAGLALHAMGDEQTELSCWVAKRDGVEPATLHERDGLEAVLARLEVNLSVTDAIAVLSEQVKDQPSAELIVVLNADSANDAFTLQALRGWNGSRVHLVAVERSGRITMRCVSAQGLRELGHTQIDVDTLINGATPKRRSVTDPSRDSDLPAAIRQAILPLRIPHQLKEGSYWYSGVDGGRTYAITPDRRLTRWENSQLGPVELFDRLPKRDLLWHASDRGEAVDALIGTVGKKPDVSAIKIDHDSGALSLRSIALPLQGNDKRVLGVCCHRGTILAATQTDALAIDPETGEVLARRHIKDGCRVTQMQGRCVQLSDGTWYGLSYSGSIIPIYVTCAKESLEPGESVISAFNVDGLDGFVNVTNKGRVLMPRDNRHVGTKLVNWPNDVCKVRCSSDGRVIAVSTRDTRKNQLVHIHVEIDAGEAVIRHSSPHAIGEHVLYKNALQRCSPRSVRVRYQMAGFGQDESGNATLYLRTRKVWLCCRTEKNQLFMTEIGKNKPRAEIRTFKPIATPPGTRYELKEAVIGDRGRVVLDTRGMIHIQPSDTSLPEVSLVVEGIHVSGWCSNGEYFGEGYYTFNQEKADKRVDNRINATKAYDEILRPIFEHFV
jgi:hypothetical protein